MIHWRNEMSVGVATIDEDHKVLIAIINEFEASQSRQSAEITCKKLFAYTQSHFQREEAIQKAYNYPDMAAQHREHGEILGKLRTLIKTSFIDKSAEMDDATLIATLSNLLHDWVVGHVLHADLDMRPFFKTAKLVQPDGSLLPSLDQHVNSANGTAA